MTRELIDELISISKQKNQLLDKMCKFTKGQREEIKKENMENVDGILNKKDAIIEKINRLDVSFLTIFSQIKKDEGIEDIAELDINKYPNLRELKEIIRAISSSLMAISLLDEENNKIIKEKLEETKMELRRIKDGKKAYKGYNATITGSMLIDEKK